MERKLNLWEATSIAVGVIIGAGIFSILGVGAQIAGRNLPLAFLLSSIAAFMVAYSYAKMGSKFISNAGPIEFIIRGIGDNAITGTLALLMWMSYVISISLFASAFAGYFLALVGLEQSRLLMGVVEVVVISTFTALNFFGSKAVGRAESLIVLVKLLVLGIFILGGIWTISPKMVAPEISPKGIMSALYAATIFFLTYTGFGLVTNASENIENPERNVPRAIYLSLIIVTVVYVMIAVVAVGNLPLKELVKAEDYALAEAAKPFLGQLGFTLVALGALFSTSSAINATLYGGANIAYALARKGELPPIFERKAWFSAPEGLYITAGLGLVFALLFNLNGIASMCSAVMLMIYISAVAAHYRLADETGGNKPFIALSFVMISAIFALLMFYQWQTSKEVFVTTWVIFGGAILVEKMYRSATKRSFSTRTETLSRSGGEV